jgi:hypothetical protein
MQTTGLEVIPGWAWPVIIVVALVQFGVQIWALVDLVRRPAEGVKGSKWLWALLVVFLSNFALGAIIYFFAGRQVMPVADERPGSQDPGGARAERAVDVLYGPGDDA